MTPAGIIPAAQPESLGGPTPGQVRRGDAQGMSSITTTALLESVFAARPIRGGVTLYTAALLTMGAALLHLAVAPAHLREYLPFGLFFLALGSLQIMLAVEIVARPTRRLALLAGVGSLGVVALWYVSRTSGLPIGPNPGVAEDAGITDVICSSMQLISAVLFLLIAARPPRRRPRYLWRLALAAAPSTLLITALTAAGVAATVSAMPEAFNAAPAVAGVRSTSVTELTEAPGSEPIDRFTLVAQVSRIDGRDAWTYNGSVPGPELRVRQGDRVQVTLVNQLPESTTLHWHGVRVPNADDGVAGLTQDAVQPGDSLTYEFVARDTGTFWYHPHQQTEAQLPRGLFGALVVEPVAGSVGENRDYTLLMHGKPGSVSIKGEAEALHLDALPGETVRLRLINAVAPGMDGGPEAPLLVGAPYRVVALDGHDLNDPALLGPTRVPLGMGQRADLVFTMPASGSVQLLGSELSGEQSVVQKTIVRLSGGAAPRLASVTIGDGSAPVVASVNEAPLFDLTRYGSAAADGAAVGGQAFDVSVPLVLEARPGFRDGRPELIHSINGESSPSVPPITIQESQRVHLHIVNGTDEYHPMHLHGHVLSVLARDGVALQGSPVYLDSVLVGPGETWDVAFTGDNSGIWMLHCHVLFHAGFGMTMTVNYAGVTTPFEMGSRSGNMPE